MASASIESCEPGFQIAPMVDVVFVLLLFFMASAGSQIVEKEITVNLPHGKGHPTTVVIEIAESGEVSLNSRVLGTAEDRRLEVLRQWFRDVFREYGDGDAVLIRPAADVRQQRIVDVLDAVSASGVKHLSFG